MEHECLNYCCTVSARSSEINAFGRYSLSPTGACNDKTQVEPRSANDDGEHVLGLDETVDVASAQVNDAGAPAAITIHTLETAAARVCRETGPRVSIHVLVHDMDLSWTNVASKWIPRRPTGHRHRSWLSLA